MKTKIEYVIDQLPTKLDKIWLVNEQTIMLLGGKNSILWGMERGWAIITQTSIQPINPQLLSENQVQIAPGVIIEFEEEDKHLAKPFFDKLYEASQTEEGYVYVLDAGMDEGDEVVTMFCDEDMSSEEVRNFLISRQKSKLLESVS